MGFIAEAVMGGRLAATHAATLDVFSLILHAGLIVKLVLLLLAALSVFSWAIIAFKWRELGRAEQDSEAFLEIYHEDSFSSSFDAARQLDRSPLTAVFLAGADELQRLFHRGGSGGTGGREAARAIARQLSWTAARESHRLERGLSFLATTGSSAPFIGLFGTVVGIIQAFQGIGAAGSASLAVVAPGIAEALVATAVGLVAAIPATIFFNVFAGRVDALSHSIDRFLEELEGDAERWADGASGTRGSARSAGTGA